MTGPKLSGAGPHEPPLPIARDPAKGSTPERATDATTDDQRDMTQRDVRIDRGMDGQRTHEAGERPAEQPVQDQATVGTPHQHGCHGASRSPTISRRCSKR